jgi:hypothetical protein
MSFELLSINDLDGGSLSQDEIAFAKAELGNVGSYTFTTANGKLITLTLPKE